MEIQELRELGFTERQAKLYVLLLERPNLSAGEISKQLSIDRSFTYSIVDSLIKKGYVHSSIRENITVFSASSPKIILAEMDEKREKAESVVKKLLNLESNYKEELAIEVHKGKPALRRYIDEMISAKEFLTLGGGGNLNIFNLLRFEYPHYLKKLNYANLLGKIICSESNKGFWKQNLQNKKIEIRSLIGAGKENSITILPDKILFSSETENPSIIILKDKEQAHSLKHYFDYLWRIAKK